MFLTVFPTVDFEYPELDENLQKIVPAAPNNIMPKMEDSQSSINPNSGLPNMSVPIVNRSLKPSAPGSGFNQAQAKISNNDRLKNKLTNNNLYPSFEDPASRQVGGTNGVKNTNLPSNAGDRGFALTVKNDLASDVAKSTLSREKRESELKEFQTESGRQLAEDQRRLEEAERKLRDLELMKKKEEKDVADLMRMKKKLTQELDVEKQRKEEHQEELALEEQRR